MQSQVKSSNGLSEERNTQCVNETPEKSQLPRQQNALLFHQGRMSYVPMRDKFLVRVCSYTLSTCTCRYHMTELHVNMSEYSNCEKVRGLTKYMHVTITSYKGLTVS